MLSLLLYCSKKSICIKIDLLTKSIVLVLDLLQAFLFGIILILHKLLNLTLLLRRQALLLLVKHRNGLLMLLRIVLLQTLDRLLDVSLSFFVLALYFPLLHNLFLCLLLDELVDGEFFLLLQRFEFNFAIIEDLLDFWVEIFEVFLEFPLHERSVFRAAAAFCEDLAKLGLVAELDSQIRMLVHFFDEGADLLDIIFAIGCRVTSHTALGSGVNNSTKRKLKAGGETATHGLAGVTTRVTTLIRAHSELTLAEFGTSISGW